MRSLIFALLFAFSLSAWPQSQDKINCDLVVGDWQGTYIYSGKGFPTQSYKFHGAYDENGVVLIDFSFLGSDETDRHEGYWYCQNGVLTTALVNAAGTPILFQYRILQLNRDHWRYQLISSLPDTPTFDADRTTPGVMIPRFLDKYPRSFFENLLPPDVTP